MKNRVENIDAGKSNAPEISTLIKLLIGDQIAEN